MRATLRHPAFCQGWNAILKLGMTSQEDAFETKGLTYAEWLKRKTGYTSGSSLQNFVAQKLGMEADDKVMPMLDWLGLFDETSLKSRSGKQSSADILLDLLLDKWKMEPHDKDLVVMQHEIDYTHKDKKIKLTSTMSLTGENRENSAMAKTVGLPMAILACLVLNKKLVPPTGVLLPNMPQVYRPILAELINHGIVFKDEVV
jgi:saccharopine dehydrogenase-like NADP-dependent oxidoreductase